MKFTLGWIIAVIGSVVVHLLVLGLFLLVEVDQPLFPGIDDRNPHFSELIVDLDPPARPAIAKAKTVAGGEEESDAARIVPVRIVNQSPAREIANQSLDMPKEVRYQAEPEKQVARSDSSRGEMDGNQDGISGMAKELPGGEGRQSGKSQERGVVFLIDGSLSMGLHNAYDQARAEAVRQILYLPVGRMVQVVVYNRKLLPIAGAGGMVPLEAGVFRKIRDQLELVRPQGSADHLAALRQSLAWKPSTIVLMTDSDDLTRKEIEDIRRISGGQTRIDVVDYSWKGDRPANHPLRVLAMLNGGSYQKASLQSKGN